MFICSTSYYRQSAYQVRNIFIRQGNYGSIDRIKDNFQSIAFCITIFVCSCNILNLIVSICYTVKSKSFFARNISNVDFVSFFQWRYKLADCIWRNKIAKIYTVNIKRTFLSTKSDSLAYKTPHNSVVTTEETIIKLFLF